MRSSPIFAVGLLELEGTSVTSRPEANRDSHCFSNIDSQTDTEFKKKMKKKKKFNQTNKKHKWLGKIFQVKKKIRKENKSCSLILDVTHVFFVPVAWSIPFLARFLFVCVSREKEYRKEKLNWWRSVVFMMSHETDEVSSLQDQSKKINFLRCYWY